jgi:histidine triad (HIT) family protein
MSCLFCEIAAGKIAADLVYQDDLAVAFLDHRPLFPGHVLLIPRRHVTTLADLPAQDVGAFFQAAQRLELAVERGMAADGSFVAINNLVSQSVPHLHVHVVPRRKKDGLKGFFWPRVPYRDDAHRQETAERIRAAL